MFEFVPPRLAVYVTPSLPHLHIDECLCLCVCVCVKLLYVPLCADIKIMTLGAFTFLRQKWNKKKSTKTGHFSSLRCVQQQLWCTCSSHGDQSGTPSRQLGYNYLCVKVIVKTSVCINLSTWLLPVGLSSRRLSWEEDVIGTNLFYFLHFLMSTKDTYWSCSSDREFVDFGKAQTFWNSGIFFCLDVFWQANEAWLNVKNSKQSVRWVLLLTHITFLLWVLYS